ncbi:MAG: hypothetical protein ACKVG0_04190 [Alphaproteobacteria bacterium]
MADTKEAITKSSGCSNPWILPALMSAVLAVSLLAEPGIGLEVAVGALIPLAFVASILMKKN